MRPTSLQHLRALARGRAPLSPHALRALHDDLCAVPRETFVRLVQELAAPPRPAVADVERTLVQCVDHERRAAKMKVSAFLPLLRERLVTDAALDADALPSSARRSLARFAEAAAAEVGDTAVLEAAAFVARGHGYLALVA